LTLAITWKEGSFNNYADYSGRFTFYVALVVAFEEMLLPHALLLLAIGRPKRPNLAHFKN